MTRALMMAAALLWPTTPALAQETDAEAEAEAMDPEEARAREIFHRGSLHFDAGEYEDAARLFEEAYELSQKAALLYNVYLASERLGHLERAIEALEGYLAEAENVGERREPLTRRLARMRERLLERRADEAEAAEREQRLRAAAAERPDPGPIPWIVAGAGAAAAAAGVVLLIVAQGDVDAVENPPGPMPRWEDVASAYDRAPTLSTIGAIALGVGGAAIIGGLTWGLVVATRSEPEVDVGVGPGFVRVRGRF